MTTARWAGLALVGGCGSGVGRVEVPPSCAEMCAAAEVLYGGCLTDWGVDWSAAGYADADAFQNACETWAWEMAILEADAVAQGTLAQPGWLRETCQDRQAAFSAVDARCDAYTDISWNDVPWSPEDTAGDAR